MERVQTNPYPIVLHTNTREVTMASVSPTPTFMRWALEAWRKGYRISWAMLKASEELEYVGTVKERLYFVGNRPKTPIVDNFTKEPRQETGRWLARFFRPVSDALIDGLSDKEVLKVWIATDRKESKDAFNFKKSAVPRGVVKIKARDLGPKNGRFFVKK